MRRVSLAYGRIKTVAIRMTTAHEDEVEARRLGHGWARFLRFCAREERKLKGDPVLELHDERRGRQETDGAD